MPLLARIVLAALLLWPVPQRTAAATTLACPTRVTVGGLVMREGTSAVGQARVDTQNRLFCIYPGVNFQALRPQASGVPCIAAALPLQATGGTGPWRFGPPGSVATVLPPVQPVGGGCMLGGPGFFVPTLTVWREAPPGQACALDARNASGFECGPAAGAAPAAGGMVAPAEASGTCPAQLRADSVPPADWSEGAVQAGYFAPESFILNAESGRLVTARATQKQVREAMGASFARAIFLLAGAPNAAGGLPPGTYACSYEGPRFSRAGRPLEATIAIACTGPCVLP